MPHETDDPEPDVRALIRALALVRRAQVGGAFAHVARRGDPDAGAVMVKVALPGRRAALYGPATHPSGRRIYVTLHGPDTDEAIVDAALARREAGDPDLWIVEIEDREGRHFLIESVD